MSRLDGGLLLLWFAFALIGLARSGRSLLAAEPIGAHRRPVWLLLAGLGVLTLGGELLGEGLRKAVSRFGVSATLLGNTAVAASVEAEEIAALPFPRAAVARTSPSPTSSARSSTSPPSTPA